MRQSCPIGIEIVKKVRVYISYQQFMRALTIIFVLFFSNFQFEGKPKVLTPKPELEVKISLNKPKFKVEEEIIVSLEIKNVGKKNEKILFETRSTSPRFATFASVVDFKTKKSVVKWQTATISSTIYTESQLAPYKFEIKPGQIIIKKCNLTDLVVIDSKNYILPKGKYELIVNYYDRNSNKVIFEIS